MTKIARVTETLIIVGQSMQDADMLAEASIIAQCIKDMTAVYETVEQL